MYNFMCTIGTHPLVEIKCSRLSWNQAEHGWWSNLFNVANLSCRPTISDFTNHEHGVLMPNMTRFNSVWATLILRWSLVMNSIEAAKLWKFCCNAIYSQICIGEFGIVYKAHLNSWHGQGSTKVVAVKTLKGIAVFTQKHPNCTVTLLYRCWNLSK